jgi:hypothetical protein
MRKREIKIYGSFEEQEEDRWNKIIHSSLEERWVAFWRLRDFHKKFFREFFGDNTEETQPSKAKKKIIISKPEWM